jgi:hypothetical protein
MESLGFDRTAHGATTAITAGAARLKNHGA